ncbi:MAG: alpha/beta hydrolase [Planctomycetota bacterium]|nr:alpha/beta hydrolase [Planctomycetota bacterium]
MRRAILVFVLCAGPSLADEFPYPPGQSIHELEGSKTALLVPEDLSAEKPASLVILLHGMGDSGPKLVPVMRGWPAKHYLVCAPSAAGRGWVPADLVKVKKIAQHLIEVMPVDKDRIHVAGFSNGGWNVHTIAFDDDLKPVSATWIAAGLRVGSAPKWAKKRLGALALAGEQDGNAPHARATVPRLLGKVKTVQCRLQPNLGHKWPDTFTPYLLWWMGAMEGRFAPGDDLNFEWGEDVQAAVESLADVKKGGIFLYLYGDDENSKTLQNEVFMDPIVRHYATQLKAVKLPFAEHGHTYGAKKSPAIVAMKKDGTVKKRVEGKITARKLASTLKAVAPNKKRPK